ncbi:MAG: hypothetical protein UZ07_CHB004002610 [Chlorobi bacterium OLB7]|nr:MAG: hypothetical protein UZ07_CHB004002610 [Chlorobi bacterium OLB7]
MEQRATNDCHHPKQHRMHHATPVGFSIHQLWLIHICCKKGNNGEMDCMILCESDDAGFAHGCDYAATTF